MYVFVCVVCCLFWFVCVLVGVCVRLRFVGVVVCGGVVDVYDVLCFVCVLSLLCCVRCFMWCVFLWCVQLCFGWWCMLWLAVVVCCLLVHVVSSP